MRDRDRDFERDDYPRGPSDWRRRGGSPMQSREEWRNEEWSENPRYRDRDTERGMQGGYGDDWRDDRDRFGRDQMSSRARFSGYEGMGGQRSREGLEMERGYDASYMGRSRGGQDASRGWFARGEREGRESFRGRGPKNYTRSDDRIREDVCETLREHDEIDATDIDVRVENCEVTLTGNVNERRMKRLAEDCVESVRGVRDVHNQIRIKDERNQQARPASMTGNTFERENGPRARS